MSFGGVGQGQVRYALIVDDQASAKIGTFKNQLNSLATGTTTVTRNMGALNNSFAGVQGGLTKTNTLLGTTISTQKTLGQQLGGLGSAFKNNALAIGAAASSVLGLYQNYANLSSAQNNANKSATAAKAAQNNLTKAQDTLNKTISKYGANSKEAKAAQDKLTVAQERAVNKTESAKIAQDNLNQTMADFGINILPNVILAGGSITQIFSNIGGAGGKLSGILSKLGITTSGLGSSFGLAGGGATGLIKTLGLVGLAVGGAVALYGEFNKVLADHKAVMEGTIPPTKAATNILDSMSKIDFSTLEGSLLTIAKNVGFMGILQPLFPLLKKGLEDSDKSAKDLVNTLKTIPASMNGAATSVNAMVNRLVVLETKFKAGQISSTEYAKGIFEVQQKLGTQGFGKVQDEANKLLGTYTQTVKQAITPTQQYGASSGVVDDALKKLGPTIITLNKNTGDLNSALVDGARAMGLLPPLVDKSAGVIQGFGKNVDELRAQFLALNKTTTTLKFPTAAASEFDSLITKWGGGKLSQPIVTYAQKLSQATASTRDLVTKTLDIQPALEKAKAAAAKFAEGLAQSQAHIRSVFKLDTNADKVLKDLIKSLPNSVEKKIKLNAKLEGNVNAFKSAFQDLINAGTQMKDSDANKIGQRIIKTIDDKFKGVKGPFAGLRAAVAAAVADPNTPAALVKLMQTFDFSTIGTSIGTDISTAIKNLPWKDIGISMGQGIQQGVGTVPITPTIVPPTAAQMADIRNKIVKAMTIPPPKNNNPVQSSGQYVAPGVNEFSMPTEFGKRYYPHKPDNREIRDNYPRADTISSGGRIGSQRGAYGPAQFPKGYQLAGGGTGQPIKELPVISQVKFQAGLQVAIANANQTVQLITAAIMKLGSVVIPVVSQVKFQAGLQVAIANAGQTVQIIGTTLAKIASVIIPVVSQVKFQAGLQLAIANAGQTVTFISNALQKVKSIVIPAADEASKFQKGLQLAILNAAQTVKFIDKALQKVKGIVVPPPNESKYQKGLQLAINNAAQTVKKIESELKKVSKITVPAPDLHNFNSALNQMVSNAKRAARDAANALKSARSSGGGGSQGRGPGATTGPFRAHGGIDIVNKPTTVTFGEAGPEAAVFIPLNGRTSSSSGRSDNSSSGMSGDLNVTNIIRLDDREILRSFRRKMGTNRFTMGP